VNHGTFSYIGTYGNGAANSVMLHLGHDFYNNIKIEHKFHYV